MKTFYYYHPSTQGKLIALIVFEAPNKEIADAVISDKFGKEDIRFAAEK